MICGKIMLSEIEIFKKILNSNFVCILKNFQDFCRTFSLFSIIQAWKLIFSFSRLSRMHENPVRSFFVEDGVR